MYFFGTPIVKKGVRGLSAKNFAGTGLGPTYPKGAPQLVVAHFRMILSSSGMVQPVRVAPMTNTNLVMHDRHY